MVSEGIVDGVVSCSVFEHVKSRWIAALEIAKILRAGGVVFIHTHQTFALDVRKSV